MFHGSCPVNATTGEGIPPGFSCRIASTAGGLRSPYRLSCVLPASPAPTCTPTPTVATGTPGLWLALVLVRFAPPPDLCSADEIFITSAVRGILPVTTLNRSPVGTGTAYVAKDQP